MPKTEYYMAFNNLFKDDVPVARWLVCSSVKEGDHTELTGSPEP